MGGLPIDAALQQMLLAQPIMASICEGANAGKSTLRPNGRRLFVLDPELAKHLLAEPADRLSDVSDFFRAGSHGSELRRAELRVSSDFRKLVRTAWQQADLDKFFGLTTIKRRWPDAGRRIMAEIFAEQICAPGRSVGFRRAVSATVDSRILDQARGPMDRFAGPYRQARWARALAREMASGRRENDLAQSCFDHLRPFGIPFVARAFAAALFSTVNSLGVALSWSLLLGAQEGRAVAPSKTLVLESLRLFPLAWNIEKRAAADFTIAGEQVRRGEAVAISPFACHRNSSYVARPNEFLPERWRQENPADVMLPFGFGSHRCPAMQANLAILSEASELCLNAGVVPHLVGSRLHPGSALTPPDFVMSPII